MDSPLKAALTGVELLVARAQLWQTTAAKHVSLDPQLQAVTALAGRWRRLELASWRRLLARTVDAYAAGASRFSLLHASCPESCGLLCSRRLSVDAAQSTCRCTSSGVSLQGLVSGT